MSIKFVRPVLAGSEASDGGYINQKIAAAMANSPFTADVADNPSNSLDIDDFKTKYRKALYESTEARYTSDLYNAEDVTVVGEGNAAVDGPFVISFTNGAFEGGVNFKPGYTVIYGDGGETDIIAIESKRTGTFKIGKAYEGVIESIAYDDADKFKVNITMTSDSNFVGKTKKIHAFARADLEGDIEGKGMPNVELRMTDITFEPRETSIGVSWTNLTEIVMDASFNLSSKDMMLRAAADAIAANLDYRAFKLAYATAKALPDNWHVEFKASDDTAGNTAVDGLYTYTAQTITAAIESITDVMHSNLNRGGVSKLVAGASAGTYLTLSKDFDFTGKEAAEGVYRYGQLAKLPVFKAPTSIIHKDDILCVKLVA